MPILEEEQAHVRSFMIPVVYERLASKNFYMVVSKLGPSFPRVREPFQPFGHWGLILP